MSGNSLRFFGMTRIQFLGSLTAALSLVLICVVFLLEQNRSLADQGAQSHKALCVLRDDQQKRADDAQRFLNLTVRQREKKYGKALGDTPEAVVQQSLRGLRANLEALKILSC